MIDYKKYLSEIGKFDTDQKSVIKKYLEEQCQNDDALRSFYSPEKIDDCYDFIKNCAREAGGNSFCHLEDTIVFKMARDFYLEILPKQTDEPGKVEKNQNEEKTETVAETAVQAETIEQENENAEKKNQHSEEPKIDNLGFEVFGEEETAETTVQAETIEQENKNVSENPIYDEDGNGLFDF